MNQSLIGTKEALNIARLHSRWRQVLAVILVSLPLIAAANPVPISLDQEVSDSILAGEERVFLLQNLTPGQRVYVQRTATSNLNRLNWLLEDEPGRVIVQDLARLDDLGPVDLMGGDYRLTVRGETPTEEGTFSFIVHSVVDTSSTLALDVVDLRSLSGVAATHDFDLPIAEPGPVRLFFGEVSSTQLTYRVTDALGNLRQDWTTSVPVASDPFHLPTGNHRIEVRGRNGYEGDFSLQARRQSDPVSVPLALNGSAAYNSADVSESTAFQFSLSDTTGVFIEFDFLHSFVAGQWRLDRADGQQIRDWSGNMSASNERLNLLAGDYTLTVRSRERTPVTGSAILHEVIDTEAVLLADVTATAEILTPGQEHRFLITGLPSGTYLLDELDTDNRFNLDWRIDDALGRAVLAQTGDVNDVEGIVLRGGDYTLMVSASGTAATGFVDFSLTTMVASDLSASLGGTIGDAIVQPGEIRRYSFTSPPDRMLSIERQDSSNIFGLNYMLHDAVGREVISRTTSLPDLTERMLAGGEYVLTVLGEGGATGSFTLALNDDGPSGFTPSGTPLALDDLAEATISSGSPQAWLLSLASPERVYFQLVEGASNLRWTLFNRAGQALFDSASATSPGFDDRGPFMLAAGNYTIEFELTSGGSADYAFQAVKASVTETSINIDEVIDSPSTVPGFRDDYLFTIPTDSKFYFELFQGDNQLRWRLEHSSGELAFESSLARFSSDSLGPLSLSAGDYRLVFEATSNAALFYQFQIHSVTDLEDSLSLGATPLPISDSMAIPGQTHDYALMIEPGVERLYIEVQSGDNALQYSLIDSAGRAVINRQRLSFQEFDDSGPLVVEPGEYRLLVTMSSPTTSNYELTLHAPQSSAARTVALDQLETWTPAGPGEEQRYLIDLDAASTRALFDPQTAAANVGATLTHVPSGWQPFADVPLDIVLIARRGPFSLPPGEYELTLRALPNAGEPAWQLSSVIDEHAGPIGINEIVVAELSTPGARLSYIVEPAEDGQALIFDLMSSPAQNRWELIDPVGTPVFGPAPASFDTSNDQGPIPLALGSYTLTFFNERSEVRDWLFRVASSETTIETPEGCAACSALDVVFAFDTSSSMDPVSQAMCDLAGDLIGVLADDGIPVRANYWGLVSTSGGSCLSSTVLDEMGPAVPGSPPPWMTQLDVCEGTTLTTENWAPATAILADRYPWDPEAVRLVIPVADDGPLCGSPINDRDIDSVYYARDIAAANNVVISPLLPDQAGDPVRAMAGLITVGTSGIVTVADFDIEDVLPRARAIAVAACGTQQAIAAPQFTDLSPLPGTLLPSGVPLVLSGRVVPVNQLRPVLEIEVNGQASSVLDGAGAFFATIELQPGPNTVTISAVEACGPTVLEIELMGAGNEADPWAGFAEVSDLLQGEFSKTTFERGAQRLLVDVAASNPGADLKGPILMAVGVDLDPGVALLNSDGVTPNGESYVVVVPEGETLPAGGRSNVRQLAFSNPGLEPIDFQPRWLLPANQAPHFTSIPTTRATVGRPWSYIAVAEDGNDDGVTYSLLVAPAGMSQSAGELSWTPTAAGSYDVVLRASDGRGGVGRQSFTINVVEPGFNAPPIFTSTPAIQAPIGASYDYPASVNDPDGDPVSFELLSAPAGMIVDPASGLVTWTNAQPGQHSVILEADDGQGGQSSQSYTLFVGEPATTQPGPAFSSTPITYAAVGTQYRYRYRLSPPQDPQPIVTLAQAPSAMSLDTAARTLNWLPEAGDLGPHVIELIATDGNGQQATQRFELTVLDFLPNQAPYITSTPPQAVAVGQQWLYPVDAVDPEFENLTFGLFQAPPGMLIGPASGELSWTVPAGTPGSVPVTLVVTDPQGLSATQEFDIAVRASNADPVLTSTPPTAVFVGTTHNHLFIANDADGDALTFTLLTGPTGMTLDAEAGWLSWLTAGVAPGVYEYEIRVSDDWGGSVSQVFDISVVEDVDSPQLELVIERQPACATEPVTVCLQASDNVGIASRSLEIDGELQNLVANCTLWTPPAPGNIPALATATDVSGLVASSPSQIQVADCNDEQAPVVNLISPQTGTVHNQPVPIIVDIDDNTPDILTWNVTMRLKGSDESVVLSSGSGPVTNAEVAVFDPLMLQAGDYEIDIVGNDGAQTGGIRMLLAAGTGNKPGRVAFTNADLNWQLGALPLTIGRSYDSLDAGPLGGNTGDFSPGWRLALSASVEDSASDLAPGEAVLGGLNGERFTSQTRITVVKPNGERVGFRFDPQPKGFPAIAQYNVIYEPDAGVTDTLSAVGWPDTVTTLGGGFTNFIIPYNPTIYELETEDGVVYVISEFDGLLEVRDTQGGVLTYSDEGWQSSWGARVDYLRDGEGRITDIVLIGDDGTSEIGRIVYSYDGAGNLASVTDLAGGVSNFEYNDPDLPHHLTAMFDALGRPIARMVFDDQGRMIAHCPGAADPVTLDGCSLFDFGTGVSSQTVFDGRGFRSELFFDDQGLLILQRDEIETDVWVEQAWDYDDQGREIEHIDGDGGVTTSEWDADGNPIARTEPDGRRWTWIWGECTGEDEWLSQCDMLGNCTLQEFDAECRMTRSIDPLGGATLFAYNSAGQRTLQTDPVGQSIATGFDAKGKLVSFVDALGGEVVNSYGDLGEQLSETERDGIRREWTYDVGLRAETETWVGAGSSGISWSNDAANFIDGLTWSGANVAHSYWPNGKVRRITHSSATAPDWWIEYSYDANDNVTRLDDSFGGVTEYDYDGLNRIIEVRQSGAGVVTKRVTIDTSNTGQPVQLRRYASLDNSQPGPVTDFEYGCLSCPTTLSRIVHTRSDTSVIQDLVYQRNAIHQITGLVDVDGSHAFVHDGRGWLIQADHPPGFPAGDQGFTWDGAGNWLSRSGSFGGATTATLGYQTAQGGHRLLSDGVHSYQYDARGALVERSGPSGRIEIERDARGNAIAITEYDLADQVISAASYLYSSNQQRVRAERDGVVRHYIFDGPNPIIALDAAGQVVWRQLHLRDPDRPLATEVGGQLTWLLADHIGSVRNQVDNVGQVLAAFSYDVFGRQLSGPAATLDDPVRYTGRDFDLPGGLGHFRLRLYDPVIGRFLGTDILEPWHYRYADNNPLNFVDPSGAVSLIEYGLQACGAFAALGAGSGAAGTVAAAFSGNVDAFLRALANQLFGSIVPCGIPVAPF